MMGRLDLTPSGRALVALDHGLKRWQTAQNDAELRDARIAQNLLRGLSLRGADADA
jgi:hypothetical protein